MRLSEVIHLLQEKRREQKAEQAYAETWNDRFTVEGGTFHDNDDSDKG